MTPEDLSPLIRISGQGLFLPCWIQPRASRTSIAGLYGDALKISLAAPPVDGKANAELCKFFAKLLGVSKSSVELVSGQTSRKKTLLIAGVTPDQLYKIICENV